MKQADSLASLILLTMIAQVALGGWSQTLFVKPFRFALGRFVCLGGFCHLGLLWDGTCFVLSQQGGEGLLRRPQLCHCRSPILDALEVLVVVVLDFVQGDWQGLLSSELYTLLLLS